MGARWLVELEALDRAAFDRPVPALAALRTEATAALAGVPRAVPPVGALH